MHLSGWTVYTMTYLCFVTGFTKAGYQYTKQIKSLDLTTYTVQTVDGDTIFLERKNANS